MHSAHFTEPNIVVQQIIDGVSR